MADESAGRRRGVGPYESLSRRTGLSPLAIAKLAADGRLGDLFRARGQLIGAPGIKPLSPHRVLGELRAWGTIWEIADRDRERRDDRSA